MTVSTKLQTVGISPKVWAPVVLLVAGAVTQFIAANDFSAAGIATAICALVVAVVGYIANPGQVTVK